MRAKLRSLDAFTTSGGRVVYVLRHSVVLLGAMSGSRVHSLALASIIWHEMAHIDGADERQARRAEEDLWRRFIRDGEIDHPVRIPGAPGRHRRWRDVVHDAGVDNQPRALCESGLLSAASEPSAGRLQD